MRQKKSDLRTEARRKALREVIDASGMKPSELARRAGLPSANLIYNFFSGHSSALTFDTYQRLANAIPGATVSMLAGAEMVGGEESTNILRISVVAQAGAPRARATLPKREQYDVPVPASLRSTGAFGVLVREPGAELIYPANTILVCLPLGQTEQPVGSGRRVVVTTGQEGAIETTVRELELRDGEAWLHVRSSHPRWQGAPLKCPWPYEERPWRISGVRYRIIGVVTMACVPEGDLPEGALPGK